MCLLIARRMSFQFTISFLPEFTKTSFGFVLPHRPKPFRVQMLLMAVVCGWIMIREKVLRKFCMCKDLEFVCILHILEEVIPLVLFHYTVIFRSGALNLLFSNVQVFTAVYNLGKATFDKSTLYA